MYKPRKVRDAFFTKAGRSSGTGNRSLSGSVRKHNKQVLKKAIKTGKYEDLIFKDKKENLDWDSHSGFHYQNWYYIKDYLYSKVGQKWDDVYSEFCKKAKCKNDYAIREAIDYTIEFPVLIDGELIANGYWGQHILVEKQNDTLYVDPRDNIIKFTPPREIKKYSRYRSIEDFRIFINRFYQLFKLHDTWYGIYLEEIDPWIFVPWTYRDIKNFKERIAEGRIFGRTLEYLECKEGRWELSTEDSVASKIISYLQSQDVNIKTFEDIYGHPDYRCKKIKQLNSDELRRYGVKNG